MIDFIFDHGKLFLLFLNVVAFVCVFLSTRSRAEDTPDGQGDVLLITAHPDDEVMFFVPLLVALRQQKRKFHVLCLSRGTSRREKEFAMSCGRLGVCTWSVGQFVDGFDQVWKTEDVAAAIAKQLQRIANVKTMVTFDSYGVSGHPNHIACWRGCVSWINGLKNTPRPNLLFLRSVNIVRKYLGIVEAIATVLLGSSPFFLSFDPLLVWRLMNNSYQSQMEWYRQLYAVFSRYAFINTFEVFK
jgi:N-acetylglucosaminylphosphatidylinositol deacetylase